MQLESLIISWLSQILVIPTFYAIEDNEPTEDMSPRLFRHIKKQMVLQLPFFWVVLSNLKAPFQRNNRNILLVIFFYSLLPIWGVTDWVFFFLHFFIKAKYSSAHVNGGRITQVQYVAVYLSTAVISSWCLFLLVMRIEFQSVLNKISQFIK